MLVSRSLLLGEASRSHLIPISRKSAYLSFFIVTYSSSILFFFQGPQEVGSFLYTLVSNISVMAEEKHLKTQTPNTSASKGKSSLISRFLSKAFEIVRFIKDL